MNPHEDPDGDSAIQALALSDLRDAIPALVVIGVVLVGSMTIEDGLTFALVVACTAAFAVGGYRYAEAGPRGARRRRTREQFDAALDATERKGRNIARLLPLVFAFVLGVVAGGGWLDSRIFAGAAAVGYVISQLAFAAWLNARHPVRAGRLE